MQNNEGTSRKTDTPVTQRRSGPVHYELVSYRGEIFGPFMTINHAMQIAKDKWPDQEQDEDRTGKGWDVQVIGS